jgi:hypothetical protein
MQSRTTGAINLGVTGSIQGTHKFFNLNTGEIIVRRKWTELPLPNEVINRLEELTVEEVDSGSKNEMYEFNEAEDDDEEEEQQQGEEIREDAQTEHTEVENENKDKEGRDANGIVHDEHIRNVNKGGTVEEEEEIVENDHEANEGNNNDEDNNGRYNLRSNRTRDCLHRFTFISVKAGLTKRGDKARKAVLDEQLMFLQLKVFAFMPNPTKKQMKKALRVHCFLTEKRDGRIKARAVADGRSQVRYKEEETYSLMVKLESIMLCSLIDALEKRHVVMVDIKGALLKAHVPDDLELIVKMEGELAKLFTELNPKFKLDEDGALYLRCLKALYGHIEAARLFYDELDNSLTTKIYFTRNKYDLCVYNRESGNGQIHSGRVLTV